MAVPRLSLRRTLIFIIMTPVMLVVIGLAVYSAIHETGRIRDEKVRETASLIQALEQDFLELSLGRAQSTEMAIRLNRRLESFDDISYLWAFDRKGTLYHHYRRLGAPEAPPPIPPLLSQAYEDGQLRITTTLTERENIIGSIQVVRTGIADTSPIAHIKVIGAVGLALLILSFVLASSLQHLISRPIQTLANLLRRVSRDKDYSLRWTQDTTTDFDALGNGFNEMLATTEAHIRRAAQFAHILEDSLNEIHLYKTDSLELIWLNRGARRQLDVDLDTCSRMRLTEVMPDIAKDQLNAHLENLTQGEHDRIRLSTRIRRSNQSSYPADVILQFARLDDEAVIVAMLLDMSERESAEDARRDFEQRLQQSQKLESLGVLAGGIAHDFNNLLTGVVGHANLAMHDLAEHSEAFDHLSKIETTAMRAGELCQQLLAYSGKGRFVVEPLDLSVVVREMLSMLEVAISKKAALQLDLTDPLPKIEADATQTRQVIMNLITNASDAIGDTSGLITIRTGCETVSAAKARQSGESSRPFHGNTLEPGDYAFVEVSDTGTGMDSDTLERIFDPFFSTKRPGRGLGLSAVLGIVRGHKGALEVQSEPHLGTTFRTLFPLAAPLAPQVNPPRQASSQDHWRRHGTILVVDDDRSIRELAAHTLRRHGLEVMCAEDGLKGLEMFTEHQSKIVAVILDLTMPGLDGNETYHAIRRLDRDVRIMLSSGYDEHETTKGFGTDLSGFIQKPYRPDDLVRQLREAFEGR